MVMMKNSANHSDIIRAISEKYMLDEDTVITVIRAYIEEIIEALGRKESVSIENFGTFFLKERESRIYKSNLSYYDKVVHVPKSFILKFTTAEYLRDLLRQLK